MTDERIAELMGWRWPTSAHPDDMLAKVRAVVHEAKTDNSQQIETLYALYQQASSQRDVLMAQQTQLIEVWKQRIKEAKTEWQGLTDAEIQEFENMELGTHDLCLEIESKLQEKTGVNIKFALLGLMRQKSHRHLVRPQKQVFQSKLLVEM